jgi:hypothetical protein
MCCAFTGRRRRDHRFLTVRGSRPPSSRLLDRNANYNGSKPMKTFRRVLAGVALVWLEPSPPAGQGYQRASNSWG